MERYVTADNQVTKYVHDDGSETAIKTTSSCANFYNTITDKIEPVMVDRNKFSVFISSSVGCPINCKFCYLTVKKFPYHKLTQEQIIKNVKDALTEEIKHKPELKEKFMKLSWMGMGDALLLEPLDIKRISKKIFSWAFKNNITTGVDGLDISTTLPKKPSDFAKQMKYLNDNLLYNYPLNPTIPYNRSKVRIFYSLHSISNRYKLIPTLNSNVLSDIEFMKLLKENFSYNLDILFHHMFLDGVNDTYEETESVINILNELVPYSELRILRYNKCENSPYKESTKFDELVKMFASRMNHVKYQISSGSEIKAACGMFLMKTIK